MFYTQGEKNNSSVLKYMAPFIYGSCETQIRAPSFKGDLSFDISDKFTVPSRLLHFLGQQPVVNIQNNRKEKSSCSAQAIYLYYKL